MALLYRWVTKNMANQNHRKSGGGRNQSGATETAKQKTSVIMMQKNGSFQCHKNGTYE
jgi:hypothetical protein